jgi:phage gp37-like protein
MTKQGAETKLVAKMRDAAKRKYGNRVTIIKQHGGQYSQVGVSDLLCCLDGVFVAAEVKAPESYGGSVSRAEKSGASVKQRLFINSVIDAGGIAAVVASVDNFMALLDLAAFTAVGTQGVLQYGYPTERDTAYPSNQKENDDE